MKQLIQQSVKPYLLARGAFTSRRAVGHTFLIYHSVNGQLPIELDLSPTLFQRQLAYLAQHTNVVDYDRALAALANQSTVAQNACILTFDDGYEDFYTNVFPLLKRHNLPAILFVTTGFVEERIGYPMLSYPALTVSPVTWEMLGEMAESGLVTLGAHTHTHPVLTGISATQIEAELAKPIELFQQRLGMTPTHFCYPRAVWNTEVETLVAQYYQSAVIGGGERAQSQHFHPYRIPRLPIRRSDGWFYFRTKIAGYMANEEAFYARVQRLLRG